MGDKIYSVRLYVTHDPDLMSLYKKGYRITSGIHDAVLALCEGEVFRYHLAVADRKGIPDRKSVQLKIHFDEEKEMEAISLLEKIPNKMRNCFLKNLFRIYLLRPYESLIFDDKQDLSFFDWKFGIFERDEKELLRKNGKTKRNITMERKPKPRKTETYDKKPKPVEEIYVTFDDEDDLTGAFAALLY